MKVAHQYLVTAGLVIVYSGMANAMKSKSRKSKGGKRCKDRQHGFKCGMTDEIVGLWVGDEKYNEDEFIYDYCSRALFNPANGKNFLTCKFIIISSFIEP